MEQNLETSASNVEKQKKSEDWSKLFTAMNEAFEQKNYDKCIQILDQLIENKAGSTTLLRHNHAVVEFYKSDGLAHNKLLATLKALYDDQINLKKESSTTLSYNLAVIHFQKHMYHTAIEVLEPIIDKLDGEDDSLKLLSSILMLRILFSLNRRKQALAFLNMIETQYFPDECIKPIIENPAERSSSDENHIVTDISNRRLKLFSLITNVLNRKIVVIPDDGSPEFGALRAHQLYAMKDFQMAAKQLQKICHNPKNAEDKELHTCIGNNMGVIHMRVRHYALAASFFQKALEFDKHVANHINNMALQKMSTAHSCEILYNLGISMLYLRRPQNAFEAFLVPIKTYHSNPRLWLRLAESCIMDHDMRRQENEKKPLYQVFFDGEICQRRYVLKPKEKKPYKTSVSSAVPELNMEFAALCLRNALRLAKYYKTRLFPHSKESVKETENEVIDSEQKPSSSDSTQQNQTSQEPSQGQSQNPEQELHQEKETVPESLPTQEESTPPMPEKQNWRDHQDANCCLPSQPISKEAFDQLFCSIYAAFSYVALRIGDYIIALEMAQELLKSEGLSDAHRILAHMYAGEALIMLEKFPEAHSHLDPCSVLSLNSFDFETKDWEVKSVEICQNIWRYNIAVAHAQQGDYDTARTFLSTVNHPIVNNRATALRIYLQMKTRKPQIPPGPAQSHHVLSGNIPIPHNIHGVHGMHSPIGPSLAGLPIHPSHIAHPSQHPPTHM